MKPSQVKKLLTSMVEEVKDGRTPPAIFLWGPPGVGKSSVVRQVADEVGFHLIDLRAVLLDPVDLRGFPQPQGDVVRWLRPVFIPPENSDEGYILFLDELNIAPEAVQKAGYQLILDRRIGEHTLPKKCLVLGAGNRPEDRTGARDLLPALANRFIHVEFELDVGEWTDWAIKAGVSPEVIAFIHTYPDSLFKFDPQKDRRGYPTPRSVATADYLFRTLNPPLVWEAIEGAVGREWGTKFHSFLELFKELPQNVVGDILNGKSKYIPQRGDHLYALVALLSSKAEERHIPALAEYLELLPADSGAVFASLLLRRFFAALVTQPAFKRWAEKHKAAFVNITRR